MRPVNNNNNNNNRQEKQVQRPQNRDYRGTIKKGMVENIKKVSEAATVTEIKKICMLESAPFLREVLSVWTECLTWVTDALGAWFAHGWCIKRTPAMTVIEEIIIIN